MRSDRERLLDMLDAIAQIQKYAVRVRQVFDDDELIQTWIVRHLQNIGEAASKISSATRLARPKVAWANIVAMRNIIVHEYFGIDRDEVWSTVEFDLPTLKRQIEAMLK